MQSWQIIVPAGTDPITGKKRQKTETVKGTKREAEQRLAEMLHEINMDTYVSPSKETVAEFLGSWLNDHAATHLRISSFQTYRFRMETYIIPALGRHRVQELSPRQIGAFESELIRGGLGAQTVVHCHRLLSQALKWGVRMGSLKRNVADLVDPPRVQRKEPMCLDWNGVRALVGAASASPFFPLYLLAILTGLRRGELLGLRWKDADLESSTLTVTQSLVRLEKSQTVMNPTKSGKIRTVDLPMEATGALRRLRDTKEAELSETGQTLRPESLVFSNPDGTPWNPQSVTSIFRRIANRAGYKELRFHDLRHTHASLLVAEGVHLKVISERLGHANIRTTGDLYAHILPGVQREAILKWDKKFTLQRNED